jgi:hypothetical protein
MGETGKRRGNPRIAEYGQAHRFKPGNKVSAGRAMMISRQRMKKMQRDALPGLLKLDRLGGDLAALKPFVAAQFLRKLAGDPTLTDGEFDAASKLVDFLWPKLAASPPPAAPEASSDQVMAMLYGKKPDAA